MGFIKWIDQIEDFFFPDYCFGCDQPLPSGYYLLCQQCIDRLKPVEKPRCILCGYPKRSLKCERCRYLKPSFDLAYQLFEYSGIIQQLIYQMKYYQQYRLSEFFGRLLFELAPENYLDKIDLILWVPQNTLFYKGFNQAYLIAKTFAEESGIELCPPAFLKKIHRTSSQTQFHCFSDKKKNISNAFAVENPLFFEHRNILIIDDVMTSGNTMNELAKKIRLYHPDSICILTVAQAFCQFK